MNLGFKKPTRFSSDFGGLKQKGPRRVGRGMGSGMGGHTTGSGHKGQNQRAGGGVPYRGFTGGQQRPMTALAQRGFKNFTREECDLVHTGQLIEAFINGFIDNDSVIDRDYLIKLGLLRPNSKRKIKLLRTKDKKITFVLKVKVDRYSAGAINEVESAGGECLKIISSN